MKRRDVIKFLSVAPLAGGIIGTGLTASSASAEEATPAIAGRDLFKELGLKTFINASCVCTTLTASLMPPEVTQAITKGAEEFVLLNDVQDKVGAKIAELCHAEAATVTAGCWSALVQGLAGAMTGMDRKKVMQLPNVDGMKSEVILQKAHANGYHQALTNTGAKLIIVETLEEVEAAISEKTAMLWFLNRELNKGKLNYEQWLALGKKHNIPTMIDIASDAHPVENLWKFNDMGFDMVAISGGKAMRGPQSTGILMGKKDLIAASRLSAPPNSGICRGHKVNKEEILAMYVALERHIKMDHEKEWKMWEASMAVVVNTIKNINGVKTEVFIPEIANNTPTLHLSWDESKIKMTGRQLKERLWNGNPGIEVMGGGTMGEKRDGIELSVWQLKPGQEKIVAGRVKEELLKASV
ncbi:aminotransferase class V-fold PLP-dependent enzyme [Daejeonella sp.]|uniref:aminotransferase class V-fold PLP-dependent enzyme n=1 Tax=Daejeonella sp. TaxID=2805397 RepID=UPI002721F8C9|nr:aminotransferase class V-fold PLP-dependent enzyme [Daejeonella sp.]MDO8993419.1 selenocysteine synthase [Daejeonella sp.]MDP2415104.1 selenocysteine synthase [Daejeonella sp.]